MGSRGRHCFTCDGDEGEDLSVTSGAFLFACFHLVACKHQRAVREPANYRRLSGFAASDCVGEATSPTQTQGFRPRFRWPTFDVGSIKAAEEANDEAEERTDGSLS